MLDRFKNPDKDAYLGFLGSVVLGALEAWSSALTTEALASRESFARISGLAHVSECGLIIFIIAPFLSYWLPCFQQGYVVKRRRRIHWRR